MLLSWAFGIEDPTELGWLVSAFGIEDPTELGCFFQCGGAFFT